MNPSIGAILARVGHLSESVRALRAAFRNPGVRRIELAYAGSSLGLFAGSIAVAVYAFRHGGATAVGVLMFVRLGLSSLTAPFLSAFADRYRQERVMIASDLVRVASVAGVALAAAGGLPWLVYVLATVTSLAGTVFHPAEASLLPVLAESPEELTAANVATSSFDSVAAFLGPALAAALLAVGGTTLTFAAVAVAYAWSASFVARIRVTTRPERGESGEHSGLGAGLAVVRGEPRLQLLIGLYSAQTLVAGAYNIFVVVIALKLLSLGSAGVGLLESATGVGAIVGAGVTLALVGRKRTGTDLGAGLFVFGAPLLAVAAFPHAWAALIALGILGVGNSVVDVSAVTLLQRSAPAAVAGRVFGLLDSAIVGALGIGALATPFVIDAVGIRGTLLVAGVLLPAVALLAFAPLRKLDVGASVPETQLAAIRSVRFLDALPLQRQEALAAALAPVELRAGETLFERGDTGDRFYIVDSGTLEIHLESGVKVEDAPAFVGEIALLRGVPRTATVRARSDAHLWALGRHEFVDAVTGHTRSRNAADEVVAGRGALAPI